MNGTHLHLHQVEQPALAGIIKDLSAAVAGAILTDSAQMDFTWKFGFSGGWVVLTESYWRLLADGRLRVSADDHGQQFGSPAPVDANRVVLDRLRNKTVSGLEISAATADLRIKFDDACVLELLNTSSGYEGWRLIKDNLELTALGGGGVARAASE